MPRHGFLVLGFLGAILASPAPADTPTKSDDGIVELYRSGALFDRKQYRTVRAAFAGAFEKKHADLLRTAFGENHDKILTWLKKRPDIREELFLALNEEHDDLEAALRLFAQLWKEFPKEIETYATLAIATAVVWDRPARSQGKPGGVYDYTRHQVRTKSKMPAELIDAKGNFEYVVNNDAGLGNTIKVLPWEFLLFVIDHKTPLKERNWARKYFFSRRGKLSSWHQDVPYDHVMLKTEQTGKGPGPKLAGHDYTLENLKRYGGVCAQQADFVARVGKSLGQPTVYVSGESSYRGWHAWVMWVNVIKSGKEKIRFELVSDGRTRGFERDAFYTGWIYDPQTGQRILDRDMERRLVTVALDPHARRQASLAMRAYPAIAQSLTLGAKERVAFLDRIWQLCPQSEEAWLELARLAKQGELKDALRGTTAARLATATKTFAKNPDFIARLSDDLLAAEPSVPQKIKHYERILVLFEKAARPDLCCETRLKISDYWSEQKRYKEAAQTLTQAVRKFPTEGRYIPRLLAACEKVCENYSAGVTPLANLYIELGPALVLHYKGEPNPFLDQVLAQGKAFFAAKNLTKQASTFNTRVAQAKARSGKS